MADREKVIYSIERCICHVPDACRDCGYDNEPCPKCFEHLLRDAHDLLKAQEPRVMTYDEMMKAEICFLEVKGLVIERGRADNGLDKQGSGACCD